MSNRPIPMGNVYFITGLVAFLKEIQRHYDSETLCSELLPKEGIQFASPICCLIGSSLLCGQRNLCYNKSVALALPMLLPILRRKHEKIGEGIFEPERLGKDTKPCYCKRLRRNTGLMRSYEKMVKILFVCHGNISKSPGKAGEINGFTMQEGACYTTTTPFTKVP